MMPPMITTPATILSFFIIFLFKNFAFSGGISVGGGGGDDGNPTDIELCEGANPSDAVDDNGWCEGVNWSGREWVSVVAQSDPVCCGDGGISDDPELKG